MYSSSSSIALAVLAEEVGRAVGVLLEVAALTEVGGFPALDALAEAACSLWVFLATFFTAFFGADVFLRRSAER